MQDASQLLQSIAGLLWPIIVAVLLWRLLPSIRKIIESRGFTVKVGGVELSVQELAEKLVKSTAELQAKDGQQAPGPPTESSSGASTGSSARRQLRRILWVDDKPRNNAYEIAQLESLGTAVDTATSTREALDKLERQAVPCDAIISDMGRQEGPVFNSNAGLDLIRGVREERMDVPIIIYSTSATRGRRDEIRETGGDGVASGPGELFTALGRFGDFPGAPQKP